MPYKRVLSVGMLILSIFVITACNLPTAPDQNANLAATLAAQTLEAMMAETTTVPTVQMIKTSTPQPEQPQSTNTPVPTNTPAPTNTNTPVPLPCDAAGFVSDVTVPDGTTYTAGSKFTKTWRLKNIGTCTWTTSYSLVFIDGNSMGAPASLNLPGNVAPGQTIDISIDLTAPATDGSYRGNFKLRNAAGVVFGTGSSGTSVFYVLIKVVTPTSTNGGYSFVDNFCSADWSSAAGSIACTAKDGDANGFVIRVANPNLETGAVDDEPGLITAPQLINDGVIRGKYPPLAVQNGDVFKTIVGCEYKATNCNVKFQLDYQVDNGSIQTLASWDETYDGKFTVVTQDLSSLAGKNVRFILTVLAKGSASGDRALWLKPRIERPAPTPTPTATP
jgi:hypothetical protein